MIKVVFSDKSIINQPFHCAASKAKTSRDYAKYCLLWTWGAPRFGHTLNAEYNQSVYYAKHGRAKFMQRVNRVCKWFDVKPYYGEIEK